jgi:hypothetical protein
MRQNTQNGIHNNKNTYGNKRTHYIIINDITQKMHKNTNLKKHSKITQNISSNNVFLDLIFNELEGK